MFDVVENRIKYLQKKLVGQPTENGYKLWNWLGENKRMKNVVSSHATTHLLEKGGCEFQVNYTTETKSYDLTFPMINIEKFKWVLGEGSYTITNR